MMRCKGGQHRLDRPGVPAHWTQPYYGLRRLEEAEGLCDEAATRHDEATGVIMDLRGRLQDVEDANFDGDPASAQQCQVASRPAQLSEGGGAA